MNLTDVEIRQFFKLWYGLVWSINEKHKIIPHFKKPVYGTRVMVSMEDFTKIRNAMWENPEWIDEYLADQDDGDLTEQERGIILGWRRHFVKDRFLVMRHLAKYTVLMTLESEPTQLYGVWGISDPLKEILNYPLPFQVRLVLLPFNGKIIFDSLAVASDISLGPDIRASAKELYAITKDSYGIIEVLDGEGPDISQGTGNADAMNRENASKAMLPRYMEVAELIERFCDEKLDARYKKICLWALETLCLKRPSPIATGTACTWACGIVYAVGANNFIFDKSQPMHLTAGEIAGWFGLAKSTAGNKAAEVNELLG